VPVEVEVSGEALVARGEFTINRSDYGMSYQSMLNPVGEAVAIGFTFRGTPVRGERTTRP